MKKLIIKVAIAILLAIAIAKGNEDGIGFGIMLTLFFYIWESWFGVFWQWLYATGLILRCISSFLGACFILMVPTAIGEALLPDNWVRIALTVIGTITLFVIPIVYDWKTCKLERIVHKRNSNDITEV